MNDQNINVYICKTRIDRLEYSENLFWHKSKKTYTSYPLYNRNACLAIGLTRTSSDGNLKIYKNFLKLYSTSN